MAGVRYIKLYNKKKVFTNFNYKNASINALHKVSKKKNPHNLWTKFGKLGHSAYAFTSQIAILGMHGEGLTLTALS